MRRIGRWLGALAVLVLARGRRRRASRPPSRIVAPAPPHARLELLVAGLLGLASIAAVAFVVVYALDGLDHQTQLLGLALGLAFAFLAAAAIATGRVLVPYEEVAEPYPDSEHDVDQDDVAQIVQESARTFTRRRLLASAAGGAGVALGAALVVPALSFGPALDVERLRREPWRRGTRLVDSFGQPLLADQIEVGSVYTAFPFGAEHNRIAAPVVVVRLEPERLHLPAERRAWAPEGLVAYSKVCTHAGCAVSLYRSPLYEPTSARPALVCPCHYSTFDPAAAGAVLFGPAGRPLPQLPLEIGADGALAAAGGFSGPVGPSWWGVRT